MVIGSTSVTLRSASFTIPFSPQVDKLRAKFETIVGVRGGNPDEEAEHTQAFCIVQVCLFPPACAGLAPLSPLRLLVISTGRIRGYGHAGLAPL